VRHYRTEIVIPPDRFVGLQLPAHLPEGRAVVTILVEDPAPTDAAESDPDRQDIEWWDEFGDPELDEVIEARSASGLR
jgi:hypothetical protein